MFNSDFYPSPSKVINLLTESLNLSGRKYFLEPSAGKGDIATTLSNNHHKVDCVESEQELCSILEGKKFAVIHNDFLTFETYSEYDGIIMNPPFSQGDKHLIHAIRLAEKQLFTPCQIRAIINADTIKNPYTLERKLLISLLDKYNAIITFHKNLFSDAERKTNIETVIIEIDIDVSNLQVKTHFNALLSNIKNTEKNVSIEKSLTTVINNHEITERLYQIEKLVRQYQYHVTLVKKQLSTSRSIKYLETLINKDTDKVITTFDPYNSVSPNEKIMNLRTQYWEAILKTDNIRSLLTEKGRTQFTKYIQNTENLEINYTNIELLILAITQNSKEMYLNTCLELFEEMTSFHLKKFSSNIHYYNGWKLNDAYKINRKIVIPISYSTFDYFDKGGRGNSDSVSFEGVTYRVKSYINDIIKVLSLIDPNVDNKFTSLAIGEFENNTIRFKMFSKGTVHIWFKDETLLDKFNVLCGQHFKWIPTDDEIYSDEEARLFIKNNFKNYLNILNIT